MKGGYLFPKWEAKTDDWSPDGIAKSRGFADLEDAYKKSQKGYKDVRRNPFLLADMKEVCDALLEVKKIGGRVVVFGDYDCDGVTGATVMLKGLSYLGFRNLDHILPNRDTGYSIKKEYVQEYLEKNGKPDLIITVDCGVKSVDDISYIVKKLGVNVVVTDHHLPGDRLPCVPTVDPHRADSRYPWHDMSGSFVALKVIEALSTMTPFVSGPGKNPSFAENELQEVAAVGCVADVMPLLDENAALVRTAIERFPFSKNVAIRMFVKEKAKNHYDFNPKTLIGFGLGPIINAAGRMISAEAALDFLMSENPDAVKAYFQRLEKTNEARRAITKEETLAAVENLEGTKAKTIVYVSPDTSDGIIGLVAGRIKERFYRPAIVIGGRKRDETTGRIVLKGSCRSIEGVNILEIVASCSDLLLGFGGHRGAAGFGILEENVDSFIDAVEAFSRGIPEYLLERKITADTVVRNNRDIDIDYFNSTLFLGPFGQANPTPTLIMNGNVTYVGFMGKEGNHFKIILNDGNGSIDCLMWKVDGYPGLQDYMATIKKGDNVSVVGELGISEYNGEISVQLLISDLTKN